MGLNDSGIRNKTWIDEILKESCWFGFDLHFSLNIFPHSDFDR